MNTISDTTLPAIGSPMSGGYFAGVIQTNGQRIAIIMAPKRLGELVGVWHEDEVDVPGALSYNDGLANTQAMAAAAVDRQGPGGPPLLVDAVAGDAYPLARLHADRPDAVRLRIFRDAAPVRRRQAADPPRDAKSRRDGAP